MLNKTYASRSFIHPQGLFTLLLSIVFSISGCVTTSEVTLKSVKLNTPDEITPSVQTLYALSRLYLAQDEAKKGGAVLNYIISLYPTFTPAYSDLAKLYIKRGRIEESITLLNYALNIDQNDPVLYNNLGLGQLLNAEYETALSNFQFALKIDPNKEKYQANLALALGLMGNPRQSYTAYRKIMSEDDTRHNIDLINSIRSSKHQLHNTQKLIQEIVEKESTELEDVEDLLAIEEGIKIPRIVEDLRAIIDQENKISDSTSETEPQHKPEVETTDEDFDF